MLSFSFVSLNPTFAIPDLKEEKRVVSNETISIHSPLPAQKSYHDDDFSNNIKSKSKSLTSLTRSGDLKSLLSKESHRTLALASASEDCLSSSIHVHAYGYGDGNAIDDDEREIMLYNTSSLDNLHPSSRSEEEEETAAAAAAAAVVTNSPGSLSSGWGQFIDFMPLDNHHHNYYHHMNSSSFPRHSTSTTCNKRISPSRRRKPSLPIKSSYRQKLLQHHHHYHHQSNNASNNQYKQRMITNISSQQQQQPLSSITMYNRNNSNDKHAVLSNEIVDAFKKQLSLEPST
jgi:hypothetical protein